MEIAVLMDGTGEVVPFSEDAVLRVYQRDGDSWAGIRETEWSAGQHDSMTSLRVHLGEVVEWLDGCSVIAAARSNGFFRVAFGGFGVALWSVRGYPPDFIEQIERFYGKDCEDGDESSDLIRPVAGSAGHYEVDLREVMAHNTSLNSRDVLLPFFRDASFEHLEILCDHMPRWFAAELPRLNLSADVETRGQVTKVHVHIG